MKHKRDFKALEKRRLKGAKLLARGVSKSEIAQQLGRDATNGRSMGAALGQQRSRVQIKRPLLIIWDGAAIHRSRKVKTWLQNQDGSLAVARLPAYAPELNPVEAIGAYLKTHEIANLCCDTEVGQYRMPYVSRTHAGPRMHIA